MFFFVLLQNLIHTETYQIHHETCFVSGPEDWKNRSNQSDAKKVYWDQKGLPQDSEPGCFWPIRFDDITKADREFFALKNVQLVQ